MMFQEEVPASAAATYTEECHTCLPRRLLPAFMDQPAQVEACRWGLSPSRLRTPEPARLGVQGSLHSPPPSSPWNINITGWGWGMGRGQTVTETSFSVHLLSQPPEGYLDCNREVGMPRGGWQQEASPFNPSFLETVFKCSERWNNREKEYAKAKSWPSVICVSLKY